ncbi:transport protein Avl9-domain-containing protein [Irpex rosettiformis]|uniref:Transport protein Avl9-domain-containing protein n=1 Tax=Irpex rosettiformis TaxID=378272 RepID=A0ACB8TY21_9APHY|nr:transport protein Avl9-domain-containing protein [Irpex rosettiformis]
MSSSEVIDSHNDHFPIHPPDDHNDVHDDHDDDEPEYDDHSDGDTASQRSISLSSPSHTRPTSTHLTAEDPHETESAVTPVTLIRQGLSSTNRDSHTYTVDTDFSSDHDPDDRSLFMRRLEGTESPVSSVVLSLHEEDKDNAHNTEEHNNSEDDHDEHAKVENLITAASTFESPKVVDLPAPNILNAPSTPATPHTASYPPPPLQKPDSRGSVASFASSSTSYSKKARPESVLINHNGPIVLGIALVDFNHLVGPKIEFSKGEVFEDEEIAKILPFLALPDGAHLTVEDYSIFRLVSPSTKPTTLFGISCNRQIRTSNLLVKEEAMTRSTVQKAVVVLTSKPSFGLNRLGVVTKALFAQRDFTDMTILEDFHTSLELGLRKLVHMFCQRTLVSLKTLMLQKKIMFHGHPQVEKLCTYQYSLVTLIPGLLQDLDDCGSPPLATCAKGLECPTELKTSDSKNTELYGYRRQDLFFQPYFPLQQLDMLKNTSSRLCGSTSSIVTQQKEVDLFIETGAFEFRNPSVERSAGLTPADRKWMDDVVKDVNDSWEGDLTGTPTIQFKGSDDYLRQKFEEYISGALASVKYSNFLSKGQGNGVVIADGAGNPNAVQDFNMLWISEFKRTKAYEVWDRVTDPLLFDIVEPRHPCTDKPSVVADIGIRLAEGINDLKLDQQLDSTRDAIQRTFTAGSTNFFKAVEGVRGRWMQRANTDGTTTGYLSTTPSSGEASKSDASSVKSSSSRPTSTVVTPDTSPQPPAAQPKGMRPLSLVGGRSPIIPPEAPPPVPEIKPSLSSWGSGITSFFSSRGAARPTSTQETPTKASPPRRTASPAPSIASTRSHMGMPVES